MTTCAPNNDIFLVHSEELRSINYGYPTVGMVIEELIKNEPDRDEWHDETVMNAIDKWDAQFADDPDWVADEDEDDWNAPDIRDELRFAVENVLGLEF